MAPLKRSSARIGSRAVSRRGFLKGAAAALGAMKLSPHSIARAQDQSTADGRDVLFIAIEDIAPLMSCYGHPIVKTPNIDALAARGVLLDRAYCQTAVCNPSRASVATALRPETTGVHGNSIDWRRRIPEGMKALPEFFRDSGYETAICGKIHHGVRYFNDATEEATERENRMWQTRLKAPGKGATKPPIRPAAPRPEWMKEDDYIARSLNWGPTGLTDIEQRDGAIAQAVAEKLKDPRERPLYMAVGFHAPHYPLRAPDRHFDLYPPEQVTLPQNPEHDLDDVPFKYGHFNTADEGWLTEGEKRQAIAAYYACISYIDACVGILMDGLRESGREENTIVGLWGDHGMHMGEHFVWRKHTLFENAARVPFIIAAPGVARAGSVCKRPVELIDIYPTLADLCGFEVPEGLEASSMTPLLADPGRPWKRAAFTTRAPNQRSLRTERWRSH